VVSPGLRFGSALIALAMVVAACAGYQRHGSSAPMLSRDYRLVWADDPASGVIHVTLEALSPRQICTGPGRWPNGSGHFGGSGIGATVTIRGQTFHYEDTAMEMCAFRDCQNPLGKGGAISSQLTYKQFGIPKHLEQESKALAYDPEPYWCRDAR
jgi:hypothetical protein